jgi:hypothetical protein
MASMGTRVFVLGGESFTPAKQEDYGTVHVLDTSLCSTVDLYIPKPHPKLLQST